jgi:DNA-binding LacI/PurR family transcriptional regulator
MKIVELEPHDARQVAVMAEVSPGTVLRFFAGLPVRPLSRRRIVRAAASLGLPLPQARVDER